MSVTALTKSWEKDGLVGVTGTPVVAHGDVYFGDWQGDVWAVKAVSGQVVWRVQVGGNVIGSPAVVGKALYVGSGNDLYRLNAATGAVVWKTVTNANPYSQINASPVVVGNLVIQGTAQFEEVVGKAPFTFRGSIGAFDTATGAQVWNFVTTPNDSTSGAGEGVWSTPAVDSKLGLVYVGTGQNISEPTGPLADSLLAIDYKTGDLKWSRQFTNPDVFGVGNFTGRDADVGASPNLWVSRGREMVGVGQKNGIYHALNAANGKEVWNATLTPGSTFGGALGSAALVDRRIIASSNVGDPATNATTKTSKIFALDPATGKIQWEITERGNVFGPISAVPGVAFVGTDIGNLYALDTATGAQLWTYAAPAQIGGGASIVRNRIFWGYGFTLFSGSGRGGIMSFKVKAAGRLH
jgi:polyvinyl alcohol dehydrogenase (cytochrome)